MTLPSSAVFTDLFQHTTSGHLFFLCSPHSQLFPQKFTVPQEHLSDGFLFDMEGRCRTDSIHNLKHLRLSATSGFILSGSTLKSELKPRIYCIAFYIHINFHLKREHTRDEMPTLRFTFILWDFQMCQLSQKMCLEQNQHLDIIKSSLFFVFPKPGRFHCVSLCSGPFELWTLPIFVHPWHSFQCVTV